MPWTRASIVLPPDAVAAAEAALEALGPLSMAHSDGGASPWYEPAAAAPSPWDAIVLQALLPPAITPATIRAALAPVVAPSALATLACDELEDRDWAREWMRDWRPMRFGSRLWICPTWLEPPDPEAVNLRLDPGNAFGTGTHATTAICLEWLAQQDLAGCTLLDYGCGSGVLAIAALRLGAAQAWACDIDAQARRTAADNAARNGVASALWIGAPESLPAGTVDVVVANILSGVLIELAPQLGARLGTRGRLALAGILRPQADAVIAAYAPWCELEDVAERDEWVLLAGTRS